MKRSVIYCRISLDKPLLQRDTLTDQEERCSNQAESLEAKIEKVFRDTDQGDAANRDKLIALKAYLDLYSRKIDYLIISYGKRLARSVEIASDLVGLLRECSIELIDCTFPMLRGEESYNNFLKLAAEGKADKLNISKKTNQAISKIKGEGKHWGRPPLGYSLKHDINMGTIIVPNKFKVVIIKMFILASQGYQIKKIRTQLKAKGFGDVSVSTISYILRNKTYCGYVKDTTRNLWRKGIHEAIINEKLFNDVQKLLTDKKKRTIRRENTQKNEELPLRNLLFCQKCGSPFTGSRIYYRCNRCSINRKNEVLHNELTEYLNIFDYSDDYANGIIAGKLDYSKVFYAELKDMIDRYNKQIVTLEQLIEKLDKKYLKTDIIPQSTYESERQIIMKEKEELARRVHQIYHLYDTLTAIIDNFPLIKLIGLQWKDSTFEKKISLLQEMFPDKLSYDGSNFVYSRLSSSFKKIELYASSNLERIKSILKTLKAEINHVSRPEVIDPKDYNMLKEINHEINMRIDWPGRSSIISTS